MKKTLFMLACAALVAPAFAVEGEYYTKAITLPSSSIHWNKTSAGSGTTGWSDASSTINIPATAVYGTLVAAPNATTDVIYYGCANGAPGYGSGDVSITTSADKSISFNTVGRGGNAGEFVALTLSIESIMGEADASHHTLSELVFTFTNDITKGAYSAWGYTLGDSEVTALSAAAATQAGENTISLDGADLEGMDRIIFVIGNDKVNTQVTGLSVKATFAPEPATATLSLLALAGLCARRRRH